MENSERLSLRLFVAADSPDSTIAVANLETLFPANGGRGAADIEIVDVHKDPARAARDAILVTPTLLKVSPSPACRILGNLKNRAALLELLGVGADRVRTRDGSRLLGSPGFENPPDRP